MTYKVVYSGTNPLPSATRPQTTVGLLLKTPMRMQGRIVTTKKTRIA